MYKELLKKIREYENIAIYRHIHPDGDAMFSTLALYTFLKHNFPEKKIKLGGNDEFSTITKKHRISDSFLSKALVIVLDTSSRNRIDDENYAKGDLIIKIDHHPIVDQFGDLNYVDTKTAACCELLADIFFSEGFRKLKLSKKVCEYLYCGILTDTNTFSTTSTTWKTLRVASVLAEKGELKISDLVNYLNDLDIDLYQKVTEIRTYLKIEQKFGHITLDSKQLKEIGISPIKAKDNIEEIGHIKDLNVWAFATQVEDGTYAVSVRSKRGYVINKICERYGGGGHACACGVKQLSKNDLRSLYSELIELSTK
ncbi:MAG: DHH family phosphoesterase [Erysipelotrichaceae bacterium]|nr:DHH family phosphoesterase [Erysipelotrichaceae bacterium]